MFFTLEKLERNTKQLKDLRYRERMEIPSFDASTPEEEPVGKRPESVVYTGTLKKGDFWITGSQAFRLMKNVSESLAGRVGIVNLLGLSDAEIYQEPSEPFQTEAEYLMKRLSVRSKKRFE